MTKMIQIRNVPDDLHSRLKARAAQRGMTLSDYLREMAEREVQTLSVEELTERIRRQGPVKRGVSAADVIREVRDEIG